MASGLAGIIADLPEPLVVLITLAVCAAAIGMAVRGFLRRRAERRGGREDRPAPSPRRDKH